MRKLLYIIPVFILLNSCNFISEQIENRNNNISKKDTVTLEENTDIVTVRKYYYEKTKTLKKEITVKNNKKNGPSKEYYPSGELRTLVHYVNSIQVGETIWYYKNGQPYRVTPYVNGKMEGIRKVYYEKGELQAEIPYKNGKLQEGTKEFDKKGNLIADQVRIVFETKDLLQFSDKYIVRTRLSNNYRKAKFYQEVTNTEDNKTKILMNSYSGIGQVEYMIPKGTTKKEIIKFYAEYKTRLGNPILIHENFDLDVENR